MTRYTVSVFREMRLSYAGIEAETPEAAAAIAHGMTTDQADNIEECNGDDLSALVDVAGDETFSQSVMIDFGPGRLLTAASKLLEALSEIEAARDAIVQAKGAGAILLPAGADEAEEA